ncbi:MAG: hypothetical protein WC819_03970 [Parcubacteria group bacterium]
MVFIKNHLHVVHLLGDDDVSFFPPLEYLLLEDFFPTRRTYPAILPIVLGLRVEARYFRRPD